MRSGLQCQGVGEAMARDCTDAVAITIGSLLAVNTGKQCRQRVNAWCKLVPWPIQVVKTANHAQLSRVCVKLTVSLTGAAVVMHAWLFWYMGYLN